MKLYRDNKSRVTFEWRNFSTMTFSYQRKSTLHKSEHCRPDCIVTVFQSFNVVYFQVILTGYEITVSSDLMIWSTWALILKEISHLLLIAYSAFNPLAYCGELIWKHLVLRFWNALLCKRNSLPNLNTEGNVTRLRNLGWGPNHLPAHG